MFKFISRRHGSQNPQRSLLWMLCCTLVRYSELRRWTWDGVIHARQQRRHASQNIFSSVAVENGRMRLKQQLEHRAIHAAFNKIPYWDTKHTSITLYHKWPLTCPHSCIQRGSSPFSWWQQKHLTSPYLEKSATTAGAIYPWRGSWSRKTLEPSTTKILHMKSVCHYVATSMTVSKLDRKVGMLWTNPSQRWLYFAHNLHKPIHNSKHTQRWVNNHWILGIN